MQRMPKGLRLATSLCLIFAFFLPLAFLPFGEHSVDGVRVSFAQFWRRGGGPAFVGVGVISVLFAYGFLRARRWIRPLVVIFGWGLVVWIIIGEQRLSFDVAMAFLMFGCLPTWYLYFRHPVREYFGVVDERRMA